MAGRVFNGGGAQAPAPAPASAVECCMCGDHGVSSELFRCRSCQFRFQHKYCSDLYPKLEHYKCCNWCLREEPKKPPTETSEAAAGNSNLPASLATSPAAGDTGGSGRGKLQRGEFGNPNRPVKKQRPVLERSASDVIVRAKAAPVVTSPGLRTRQGPGRPRIRRYKLLEEVSS